MCKEMGTLVRHSHFRNLEGLSIDYKGVIWLYFSAACHF